MADTDLFTAGFFGKLTKRERMLVMITLLCVVSAIIYQFPYSMYVRMVQATQTKIETTEKEIFDLTAQFTELKQRAARGDVNAGWQLADQKNAVLFLEDVSGEARRLGVNLVAVHPAQEVDKERYREVSMNLDLKGRYRELGEYFKHLESLSKLVNVRKIRIEACPDSSSVCAAQIEAVTYVSK